MCRNKKNIHPLPDQLTCGLKLWAFSGSGIAVAKDLYGGQRGKWDVKQIFLSKTPWNFRLTSSHLMAEATIVHLIKTNYDGSGTQRAGDAEL